MPEDMERIYNMSVMERNEYFLLQDYKRFFGITDAQVDVEKSPSPEVDCINCNFNKKPKVPKEDLPDNTPEGGQYRDVFTKEYFKFVDYEDESVSPPRTEVMPNGETILFPATLRSSQNMANIGPLTSMGVLDKDDKYERRFDKYDSAFINAVAYWNEEMGLCLDNEQMRVIADFIKHIAMVESSIGYGAGAIVPRGSRNWVDSEDVMQVADPQDPSMGAMRGETEERWRTGSGASRPFEHDFDLIVPVPGETAGSAPAPNDLALTNWNIDGQESIFWGARWFLHLFTGRGGGWRCGGTLTQEMLMETAAAYNGGGDPRYTNKVRKALEQGEGSVAFTTPAGRKQPKWEPSTIWSNLPKS
ncbi:MAG: hypothetical protein NUW37_06895 [Planctomycetes bacterium]|nr:hypothetical protein [Planctomycetota bacterium]